MVKITDDGLVLTVDSDDEEVGNEPMDEDDDDVPVMNGGFGSSKGRGQDDGDGEEEDGDDGEGKKGQKQKKKKDKKKNKKAKNDKAAASGEMDPSFAFEEDDDGYGKKASWDFRDALEKLGLKVSSKAEGQEEAGGNKDGDDDEEGASGNESDRLDEDALKDLTTEEAIQKAARKKQRQDKKAQALAEARQLQAQDTDLDPKAKDFFQEVDNDMRIQSSNGTVLFNQLNLSRPLLRAVEAMGYVTPTPVQTAVIPVVLAGKDVCGSAVTGSGKTAAFCLPILERLLFRPRRVAATRVLIVSPTRELAVQTHLMLGKLCQFTDIVSCLVVGGTKNLRAQEAELRARPDIVVCTPGRMLDHLTNSHGVSLDDLEILVMDEVDQLVDLGFSAEVESLVKECPRQRQTLLFSATMTAKVDALAQLALNKPVRIRLDSSYEVAPRLEQEFVRVRGSSDEHRHAILLALVSRTFRHKTLVFCNTKVDAHRSRLILQLSGIPATELHGNLNQAQRLENLTTFKEGKADVLVCTDVAARGLDMPGIQTVINAEMPRTRATYVHRVGRTARAGCGGRAVSLVPDATRLLMKQIVADVEDKSTVKSRVIPPAVLAHYEAKVSGLQGAIENRLKEEDAERLAKRAEMEAERAQNLMEHRDEIMQRPARQWFQTEAEKAAIRAQAVEASKGIVSGGGVLKAIPVNNKPEKGGKEKDASGRPKKPHRLSRIKRRRMEAMKADEEERQAANDDDGSDEEAPKKKKAKKTAMPISQKAVAREAKRAAQPKKARVESGKAAGETRSKAKIRPAGSAGTYQLSGFDEDMTTYEKKGTGGDATKTREDGFSLSSAYRMKGPSATGLRKSGKPSHHAFKSKSKHKRR